MDNQSATTKSVNQNELFIRMALSAWDSYCKRTDKLLESLTNEDLMKETAPGRNRGIYLLGHLISTTDGMLPLLGFGPRNYPELEETFLTNADDPAAKMPSLDELRKYWKEANGTLTDHISKMQPGDWFTRHTVVSEEDFKKEPHRNKLNIILNRTSHLSYHLGQLIYLSKREEE